MLNKEPWLSVNLSKILPGIGQLYSGKKFRGYIILFLYIDLWMLGLYSFLSSDGNIIMSIGAFPTAFILWFWNLFDAYSCAKQNNYHQSEIERKRSKDPWLAMFLSQTFFGIGNFYIGKWLIGILALIFTVAFSLFLPFITPFFVGFIAYLTYNNFYEKRVHEVSPKEKKSNKLASLIAILIMLSHLLTVSSVAFTRTFLVEQRWIATLGMEPTLQGGNVWEGDKILVDKFNYHFRQPQRGDIILFSATDELKKQGFNVAFTQRVIGLPGEKVELKNGQVYINNKLLDESKYLKPREYTSTSVCVWGGYPYLADAVIIPANSYLVLGDNRSENYDGRCWGTIPRNSIIGKAYKRFLPLNRTGSLEARYLNE